MEVIHRKRLRVHHDHLMVCRICKETKIRRFCGLDKRQRSIFRSDENDNKWSGKACPKCAEVMRSRLKGHLPIDDIRDCASAIGRRCEHMAKDYFESLGFSVKMNNVNGPDLKLFLGDNLFATCEVKKVTKSKRGGHEKWFMNPVRPNRTGDDIICYVFGDGFFVTRMDTHLRLCGTDGTRYIKKHERRTLRGIRPLLT